MISESQILTLLEQLAGGATYASAAAAAGCGRAYALKLRKEPDPLRALVRDAGRFDLLLAQWRARDGDAGASAAYLEVKDLDRCGGCGALVWLPCVLCATRAALAAGEVVLPGDDVRGPAYDDPTPDDIECRKPWKGPTRQRPPEQPAGIREYFTRDLLAG